MFRYGGKFISFMKTIQNDIGLVYIIIDTFLLSSKSRMPLVPVIGIIAAEFLPKLIAGNDIMKETIISKCHSDISKLSEIQMYTINSEQVQDKINQRKSKE